MKAPYLKLTQLRFADALKRRGKLSLAAEAENIGRDVREVAGGSAAF